MREDVERVVEIRVTTWAVVAVAVALTLVLLALVTTLTDASAEADSWAASDRQTAGSRAYYLTKTGAFGATATTACAAGYHMASLWEIADPSNLHYNTALGKTSVDSGSGPSTEFVGWVRTGYASDDSAVAGRANCLGWQSSGAGDYGTSARLVNNWTAGAEDLGVWDLAADLCGNAYLVWCVEDL